MFSYVCNDICRLGMRWRCATFQRSLEDSTLFEASPLESETRCELKIRYLWVIINHFWFRNALVCLVWTGRARRRPLECSLETRSCRGIKESHPYPQHFQAGEKAQSMLIGDEMMWIPAWFYFQWRSVYREREFERKPCELLAEHRLLSPVWLNHWGVHHLAKVIVIMFVEVIVLIILMSY